MEDTLINNTKMLTDYLSVWVERSTKFKIKKIEYKLNDDSIWKED